MGIGEQGRRPHGVFQDRTMAVDPLIGFDLFGAATIQPGRSASRRGG